jgi:hypothetical protein
MAIPMIAAGIAAKAIAKKLATRAVGGITGAGSKSVGSVYKNQGFSEAVLKRPGYTPKNSLGPSNVKKTYDVSKSEQKMVNEMKTQFVNDRKSGVTAKKSAAIVEKANRNIPKKPTIKIKSGK